MADYGMDITANSYPDYDSWGYDNYWSCTDWMIWYGKLKQAYGADEARLRWKSAWEKQDATASPYLWCLYSDDFYDFVRENELGLENTIADVTAGTGSALTGLLGGLGWFGRNLKWIAPTALILVGSVYAMRFYKEFK